MTLRHDLSEGDIKDERGGKFIVNKILDIFHCHKNILD